MKNGKNSSKIKKLLKIIKNLLCVKIVKSWSKSRNLFFYDFFVQFSKICNNFFSHIPGQFSFIFQYISMISDQFTINFSDFFFYTSSKFSLMFQGFFINFFISKLKEIVKMTFINIWVSWFWKFAAENLRGKIYRIAQIQHRLWENGRTVTLVWHQSA